VTERTVTRRALVRLSAATKIADRTPHAFDWSLQLTAPDPSRLGAELHTASCGLPLPAVGLSFPAEYPLQFGESRGASLALTNAGTAVTWPVWTIAGPCDQPLIRNNSTGEWLGFGLRLLAGDALVVDTSARTVRLGGASRRAALQARSTWFGLLPGITSVSFDAANTEEAGMLTVTWRDAWA
jgi:hypothetical protein